jgi:hypothetical protein
MAMSAQAPRRLPFKLGRDVIEFREISVALDGIGAIISASFIPDQGLCWHDARKDGYKRQTLVCRPV